MGDADLSYDFSTAMPFVEAREGYDLSWQPIRRRDHARAMPWKNRYIALAFCSSAASFRCPVRTTAASAFQGRLH